MNTNTVEQADRLDELGMHPYFLRTGSLLLTLDDLHLVFEWLYDNEICLFSFYHQTLTKLWCIRGNFLEHPEFPRTTNHAEDLTTILIWLLENNHITPDQVNEALSE